jgi:hypothetical protein
MSFRFNNLNRLGKRIGVPIPKDENGYVGRECPVATCEGYFKIRPGTGLTGENLPCHCPYCGHTGPTDTFWTKDQLEYAKSVALREITNALRKDLKGLEFDHKPKGQFGIGISMKLKHGPPLPVRYYREQSLETAVTCDQCTLDYAVFGVFGFCPDCRTHNSLQILLQNLSLTRKQIALADSVTDSDLRRHLVEDALENCVSAFDGFAREACRIRSLRSTDPAKAASLSFQNTHRAADKLKALFAIDIEATMPAEEWRALYLAFMRRHLIAHKAGVVDQQYLDETGEAAQLLGRRLSVVSADVLQLLGQVEQLGRELIRLLPDPG